MIPKLLYLSKGQTNTTAPCVKLDVTHLQDLFIPVHVETSE